MDLLSKKKFNIPAINIYKKPQLSPLIFAEESELRSAISYALLEWKSATLNFETADSAEMVEYYTYKMKACEIRYQYLLKQIKSVKQEVT